MARGWESKSVADQIEEGNSARPAQNQNAARSTEERLQRQRIESLQLSRTRLLQQLELATNPAYRRVLQNGLRAVESEIEELTNAVDVPNRLK